MLAGELTAAGITIDPAVRARRTARIRARGEREFERLREEIGIDITPYKQPCIRSLGVGAALTEFAISGVPLAHKGRLAVIALGGVAVLMVSAVDSALDRGVPLPCLLPPDGESEGARSSQPIPSLIRAALNVYFRRLAALPQASPQLCGMVKKAIDRMYAAELETVFCPSVGRRAWWRKNVLPIAILGIPAWMAAGPSAADQFRRHLAWLCRLGEFFGWLDDCVDYGHDLANAHANRIDTRLQSRSQAQLVRDIAGQAKRILTQWDAVNPLVPARDYFAVIVWGWIEHRPEHATS